MIHVEQQPEPSDFDAKVRQKGLKWLQTQKDNPNWDYHEYWRDASEDLYHAYHGICAYLAIYIERVTGGVTVDHFKPKAAYPELAYEWSNYRLASQRVNSRKREFEDVLDPFEIENEWFYLNFLSGEVFANPGLSEGIRQKIDQTIDRLKLNDAELCRLRCRHFWEYKNHEYTSEFLKKRSPFVWAEAHRQALL